MPVTLKASLAFVSFPSDNPSQTREFFQQLFGTTLEPALSEETAFHAAISPAGIGVNVGVRHSPQESATAFIAVDDITAAISLATSSGGRVVWGPSDLTIPKEDLAGYQQAVMELDNIAVKNDFLAHAAIVVEPGGSQVGLVQLADHAAKHYGAGQFRQPLTDYQVRQKQLSASIAQASGRQ